MKRIFRFIKALCKYILHGKRIGFHEYEFRIGVCDVCYHLDADKWKCRKCGCYVDKKAKMSTEECPEGYWKI